MINFNKVKFEASFGVIEQVFVSNLPEFVFAGHSNVGKSSLINKLMNCKKLAHVSSTPGKTITINFFKTTNARFVDLPGYGYANISKSEQVRWNKLVNNYFQSKRKIALVLALIDIRHKPSKGDLLMISMLDELNLPSVLIFTKADKIAKTKVDEQVKFVSTFIKDAKNRKCIPFSSITGQGIDKIKFLLNETLNIFSVG